MDSWTEVVGETLNLQDGFDEIDTGDRIEDKIVHLGNLRFLWYSLGSGSRHHVVQIDERDIDKVPSCSTARQWVLNIKMY